MIRKVSLKNFKCFKNLSPIGLSQITLFTGSNGRGKSSLIQSLLLIAQSFGNDRQINYIKLKGKFVDLGTYNDILCCQSDKGKDIEIYYETDDKEENCITFKLSPYKSRERWAYFTQLNVCDNNGCRNLVELSTSEGESDPKDAKPVVGQTSTVAGIQQLSRVYYIAADRQPPVNNALKNDNIENNQIGIHGENLINILHMKGEVFVKQVAQEISVILKGASVHVEDNGSDFLKFLLDSSDESKGFRPVNVGFGYSYLLPIILTCMLAEKGSKLMVENPEAHLHPGAQSRLMDFMVKYATKNGLQLLIETHSDHIINQLRIAVKEKKIENNKDASIIHFTRNQKEIETPAFYEIKIDSRGNLSQYPSDFLDEWGLQMSKLI